MKAEHRIAIKCILKKYETHAYNCLYPENDWAWGSSSKNRKNTVNLMNDILKEVPLMCWPNFDSESEVKVNRGKWTLYLKWVDGKRSADLKYRYDDHTAWVIQKRDGTFKDFDIGGS